MNETRDEGLAQNATHAVPHEDDVAITREFVADNARENVRLAIERNLRAELKPPPQRLVLVKTDIEIGNIFEDELGKLPQVESLP